MAIERVEPSSAIVKISNEFARTRINVSSKTATDILACLIASINSNDTEFSEVYSIAIKNYLGDEGRIYKYARLACKELAMATLEEEWIEQNEEDPEDNKVFLVMPIFASLRYRKGIIKASFNPKVAKHLLQLFQQKTRFTQLALEQFLGLQSVYSKNMFRQLKSWASLPDVIVSVADLHNYLDTPESFRTDFRQFRTRVLEKTHQDILKYTDLRYEWEPVPGRPVMFVRFIFAPGGKRALDSAARKAAEEAKARRLKKKRHDKALECAKQKQGLCRTMDKSRLVCQVCQEYDFCGDLLRADRQKVLIS